MDVGSYAGLQGCSRRWTGVELMDEYEQGAFDRDMWLKEI